jgi:hypothetical protein
MVTQDASHKHSSKHKITQNIDTNSYLTNITQPIKEGKHIKHNTSLTRSHHQGHKPHLATHGVNNHNYHLSISRLQTTTACLDHNWSYTNPIAMQ